MKSDWINYLELRVCGLMRSGNHAIIEWIMNQHADKPACFLNNIQHGDFDPYQHYSQRVLQNIDKSIETETLRHLKKGLLICSYEDRSELMSGNYNLLHSALRPDLDVSRRHYLLSHNHFIDILIIRDPFNCLASRFKLLQTRGAMGGIDNHELIVYNWKVTAKATLALMAYQDETQLVINYNRWLVDLTYRQQLSSQLLGIFSDTSLDNISEFGGGSSFSNIDICPNYGSGELFQRWREMLTDRDFRKAIADPEILELSEKIFEELPGTREFIQQL